MSWRRSANPPHLQGDNVWTVIFAPWEKKKGKKRLNQAVFKFYDMNWTISISPPQHTLSFEAISASLSLLANPDICEGENKEVEAYVWLILTINFEVRSQHKIIWEFSIFLVVLTLVMEFRQAWKSTFFFSLFKKQSSEPRYFLCCQKGKEKQKDAPCSTAISSGEAIHSSLCWYIQKSGRYHALSFFNLCFILIFRKRYSSNLRAQQFQQG